MFFFQRDGGRDAFWTFFAAYLVLLTPGKNQKSLALVRVGTTLSAWSFWPSSLSSCRIGCSSHSGVVILFAGIGLSPAYQLIGGGLTTMGSVLLAGAPTGAVGNWAERRLVDTAVGCAVALIATYLLWPRDREVKEPVPAPT
jgi:hypothetical protein